MNSKRVVIAKKLLKNILSEKESIAKSLSRFIDNSIEARSEMTTPMNPCRVLIKIFPNLILIADNSGGMKKGITAEDIFELGNNDNGKNLGIGMKKSFFTLGNKIDVISNKKGESRQFWLDFNTSSRELEFQSETIDFNKDNEEGTIIYINDLEKKVENEILKPGYLNCILLELGKRYIKFIEKRELIIDVNNKIVKPVSEEKVKINSRLLLTKYDVTIYKHKFKGSSGIDVFVKNFLIYDREHGKNVRWNLLNTSKHSYRDCSVEVNFNGNIDEFESDKDKLFSEVINFIKDNEINFRSNTITVQFEMDLTRVEELKYEYDLDSAKAVGIKAFEKLYEDYIWKKSNNK